MTNNVSQESFWVTMVRTPDKIEYTAYDNEERTYLHLEPEIMEFLK